MNQIEDQIRDFYDKKIQTIGPEKFNANIEQTDWPAKKMFEFLKDNIKIKGTKILDAGCGEGRFSKYFLDKNADITSLDFSEEVLNIAKRELKNGKFVLGSITKLPLKNNSFDYVFSVDVLQHIPKLQEAIRELHRVLKPGGTLIILDKNKFGLHPKYLLPQIIIKKYKKIINGKYSGFTERWFSPKGFNDILKNYFRDSKYYNLIEQNKSKLFVSFPNLNLFVAWVAIK